MKRVWRDLGGLLSYKPARLHEALLQTSLAYLLLVSLLVLGVVVTNIVHLAQGAPQLRDALIGVPLNGAVELLGILPLFWIGSSRGLSWWLSLTGLLVLWAVAFVDHKFMTTTLSDQDMVLVAAMFAFLWSGNRVIFWLDDRKARKDRE